MYVILNNFHEVRSGFNLRILQALLVSYVPLFTIVINTELTVLTADVLRKKII